MVLLQNPLFLALITAVCASAWPALMKISGVHPAYAVMIVYSSAVVFGIPYVFFSGAKPPTFANFIPLFISFCLAGIAIFAYVRIITLPGEELSRNLVVVSALFPLAILLWGRLLLKEALFEPAKVLGVIFVTLGILLLSPVGGNLLQGVRRILTGVFAS